MTAPAVPVVQLGQLSSHVTSLTVSPVGGVGKSLVNIASGILAHICGPPYIWGDLFDIYLPVHITSFPTFHQQKRSTQERNPESLLMVIYSLNVKILFSKQQVPISSSQLKRYDIEAKAASAYNIIITTVKVRYIRG